MARCAECKETWTGKNRCHCSGCHRTFGGVGGFDRHRRDFKCLPPEECGMTLEDNIWVIKMSPEIAERLKNLSAETLRKENNNETANNEANQKRD